VFLIQEHLLRTCERLYHKKAFLFAFDNVYTQISPVDYMSLGRYCTCDIPGRILCKSNASFIGALVNKPTCFQCWQ